VGKAIMMRNIVRGAQLIDRSCGWRWDGLGIWIGWDTPRLLGCEQQGPSDMDGLVEV
jgi:hypothetical protein